MKTLSGLKMTGSVSAMVGDALLKSRFEDTTNDTNQKDQQIRQNWQRLNGFIEVYRSEAEH